MNLEDIRLVKDDESILIDFHNGCEIRRLEGLLSITLECMNFELLDFILNTGTQHGKKSISDSDFTELFVSKIKKNVFVLEKGNMSIMVRMHDFKIELNNEEILTTTIVFQEAY